MYIIRLSYNKINLLLNESWQQVIVYTNSVKYGNSVISQNFNLQEFRRFFTGFMILGIFFFFNRFEYLFDT